MRAFDNGAFYTVQVTMAEVEAFKRTWPCSGLPSVAVAFQYDKRNGDLVDIMTGNPRVAEQFDGPAALALSEDAQAYGKKRLRLRD